MKRLFVHALLPATLALAALSGCQDKRPAAPAAAGIEVSKPCAFPVKAGEPVGVTYLNITNRGPRDDRLVAVRTNVADHVETHQSREVDGVMQMVHLDTGFALPAGETLVMEPGSFHLMLMDLKADLVEGESFEMVLTFEKGGEQSVRVPISFELR